MSEVKKQPRSKNFYLFTYQQIQKGWNPSQICKKGITKQRLNYYLSSLKRRGLIRKIGYGTWEICADYSEKEVKKTTQVATNNQEDFKDYKPDSVRGHAFMFTLRIPKGLRNWNRREEILKQRGFKFKPLKIFGGGQQMTFRGRKVWLTNKSIIIFEKASFMADTSKDSRKHAVGTFLTTVKAFERYIQANFTYGGKYQFRVSRQHYSLIKNALAQQYDKEGKKLHVYTGDGLWLLIDNSYNLHETETVHPKTADIDNKPVQDFFNGLKQFEGYTPQLVMTAIGKVTENQQVFAENQLTHIKVIKELGTGVKELRREVKKLHRK
jgi:hypothetical protein